MTLMSEPMVPTEPPMSRVTSPPPQPRKMWPWIVAGIVVVAVVLGGAAWWLLDSTVSSDDYDEVATELDASEQALAAAEARLQTESESLATAEAEVARLESESEALTVEHATVTQDLAEEKSRVEALAAGNEAMRAAIVSATTAAEANAADMLNFNSDFAVLVRDAGADLTFADQLLADLGRDETFVRWAIDWEAGNPWFLADRAIMDVDDPALTDAWTRWNSAEPGTPEEDASWSEYQWRLTHLILEPLLDVETSLGDIAATTAGQ